MTKKINDIQRQILIDRYKFLMNKDIDDFSIGIKNIKVKKQMEDIEKQLSDGRAN